MSSDSRLGVHVKWITECGTDFRFCSKIKAYLRKFDFKLFSLCNQY